MVPKSRAFLRVAVALGAVLAGAGCGGTGSRVAAGNRGTATPPNFLLVLSDDQGWGDVGYNGHPDLRTPHLDRMARRGVRFDRFYAAAPLCSPTRASLLTGRHPYRYGIHHSRRAVLPQEEVTVAELVRDLGYATGHFGKWHLGGFTPGDEAWPYSPPWENGFDVCCASEGSLPTWDPAAGTGAGRSTRQGYWAGTGKPAHGEFEGDASRVVMDRVEKFVRRCVRENKPFLATVWLHAPHYPIVTGGAYAAMYAGREDAETHYYGSLTAMDDQIGRLRRLLRDLDISANTALLFASDNGPVLAPRDDRPRPVGSAGFLRGGKATLLEGGIRVPAVLEWPARAPAPRVVTSAWSTLDVLPTVAAAIGAADLLPAVLDGESLLPLLDGSASHRRGALAFQHGSERALIEGRIKLLSRDDGASWELHDVEADPGEAHDLAAARPETVARLRRELSRRRGSWMTSWGRIRHDR